MCAFPAGIHKVLKTFLEAGEPKLHLLGAAGECRAIEQFMQGAKVTISPTIQISMLDTDISLAGRRSSTEYHEFCRTRYPHSGEELLSNSIRNMLSRLDTGVMVNRSVSLGALAETEDAVFGGQITATTGGVRNMILVQVNACFAPNNIPVLYTLTGAVDSALPPAQVETKLKAALALAETMVDATLRIYSKR
jgi:hypothetical protein